MRIRMLGAKRIAALLMVVIAMLGVQAALVSPALAQVPGVDDCKQAPNPERPGSGTARHPLEALIVQVGERRLVIRRARSTMSCPGRPQISAAQTGSFGWPSSPAMRYVSNSFQPTQ